MELPEILKKQIDELINGLSIKQLDNVDLPGWVTNPVVLHKNGKPIFVISENIMGFRDLKIFPSSSNLILYGYKQSPKMGEYLEQQLNKKTGLNWDFSYVMESQTEKKYLDVLIPALQPRNPSSIQ